MKRTDLKKYAHAMLAAVLLTLSATACLAAEPRTVSTTLPWLTSMARFIVGSTIHIQPLSKWEANGNLQSVRKPQADSIVIALDPRDAKEHNLAAGSKGLHLLYENLPVTDTKMVTLPFDPSVLPFLSQRMLIVISELEPGNYPYYQRRLAEFQSRMESTLEVGRSLVKDSKLLDLTGAASPWIQAATTHAVRPPDDLWAAWAAGNKLNELTSALSEAGRRGWTVVTDAWTPGPVKSKIPENHKRIVLNEPAVDYDFFTYLHDIYLEIWGATVRK